MSDAFDDLERQLRRAVRAADNIRPLRSRRGWRRTSVIALAAALAVSGGALAATQLVSGQSAETQGRKIALQAVRDTRAMPACAPAVVSRSLVLSDARPLPEVLAAVPALATAAAPENQRKALALLPGGLLAGPVLRRTLRVIVVGDATLVVFVKQGVAGGAVRDPEGCRAARRERAATLSEGRPDAVKRWAERRLAELADTGLQTLMVMARVSGQSGMPGGGTLVRPGRPLRPGLVVAGSAGHGRQIYGGIAPLHAARVLIRDKHGHRLHGVSASSPVHEGFYAVVLPRGTGPVRLRAVSGDGATLAAVNLRG